MPVSKATLHMFCGKIAAGKSTLANSLAQAPSTVRLSEDHFLSELYQGDVRTLEDYVRCATRLRSALEQHVQDMLRSGVSVVLDFQANTPESRRWMRRLFEDAGADHRLHYLTTSDEICRRRLRIRNASGSHPYQVSDADFDLFSSRFVPPGEAEGFNIVLHSQHEP